MTVVNERIATQIERTQGKPVMVTDTVRIQFREDGPPMVWVNGMLAVRINE